MNFYSLSIMVTDVMVERLPTIRKIEIVCRIRQMGKQSRKSFPKERK